MTWQVESYRGDADSYEFKVTSPGDLESLNDGERRQLAHVQDAVLGLVGEYAGQDQLSVEASGYFNEQDGGNVTVNVVGHLAVQPAAPAGETAAPAAQGAEGAPVAATPDLAGENWQEAARAAGWQPPAGGGTVRGGGGA